LGITKYEPEIPTAMAGEVCYIGRVHTIGYDIENLKKYPDVIEDGTEVVVTEKLHGTFCQIGFVPGLAHPELFEGGNAFVASKGLGAKGLVFKNNENNKNNVYVQEFLDLTDGVGMNIIYAIERSFTAEGIAPKPVYIMGEIFGKGIQDLTYDETERNFRVFDIYVGKPGEGKYLNYEELEGVCKHVLDLALVPILYKGPYSRAKMDELALGMTVMGNGKHVREGIVIKPVIEKYHDSLGRINLKHINEAYLLRKGGTEFN
jgi:RNA ligase (TIGR02306 family)